MKLDEIADRYATDKRSKEHNYTEFYEKYFEPIKDQKLKIIEIGIYRPGIRDTDRTVGASIKTWYDYFPNSQIFGADGDNFKDIDNDRIQTIICNQEYRLDGQDYPGLSSIIKNYCDEFDIIIDDGGHTMKQQLITLGYMFKYLKSGGIFVIEDLHTSYFSPHVYNSTNTKNTTLNVLTEFQKTNKIISEFMTEDEINYLNQNVQNCYIHKGNNSEITFIIKK